MAKIKKAATLLTSFLLCGISLFSVACNKGNGGQSQSTQSQSESPSQSESVGESSSSSEDTTPESYVFALEEHTWTDWETVTEKNCTQDGKEKLVCTDEGCGKVKYRTIKAGHVFGEWTGSLDNLCTQDATLTRSCADCSHVETQTVSKRGHAYSDNVESCSICEAPFELPTLTVPSTFTDVWDDSIYGNGEAFFRKELQTDTFYTMEVPVTDDEAEFPGVWISVSVSGPGQYALLTIDGANGVSIDRYDANDFFITPVNYPATEDENGEYYSTVNCGEIYWNDSWRATWCFTADTAATVKFVVVQISDAEWAPKTLHETAIPQQINNVTADEAPESYVPTAVDYNEEYYYDEWNEVYRLGSKEEPGEVIYLAIDSAATRLFGEKTFTNIQEDGNNLSFPIGKDELGNYLVRDYHAFLLASESTDGNAYENFLNSDGMYPVTQELYEFMQLYTTKYRPLDIPDSIWDDETERVQKAWLAPCYCYRELTPGSEDNPYAIETLGDVDVSLQKFEIAYYQINLLALRAEGPVDEIVISCSSENARANINGQAYTGPFEVTVDVSQLLNFTFYIATKNFAADSFTLNVSVPTNAEN